jgi:hypothetical protein
MHLKTNRGNFFSFYMLKFDWICRELKKKIKQIINISLKAFFSASKCLIEYSRSIVDILRQRITIVIVITKIKFK